MNCSDRKWSPRRIYHRAHSPSDPLPSTFRIFDESPWRIGSKPGLPIDPAAATQPLRLPRSLSDENNLRSIENRTGHAEVIWTGSPPTASLLEIAAPNMTETQHTWSPDWGEQIDDRARALGYADVTELLGNMPGQPYGVVADRLGGVAPIQIITVQFREAKRGGRIREAAKDSLVRNLNEQLPSGWGTGENAEWQSVRALASWSSELQVTGDCEELKSTLFAIAQALRGLPPPEGWVPRTPVDPIIECVFNAKWS